MVYEHVSDALAQADLIHLDGRIHVLRFEAMKVASALGAVRQLMSEGSITPGDTLVDSSSGIYAYSLALACHKYGFKCHIVASPSVDLTLKTQLHLLGATVDQPRSTKDASLDQAARVKRVVRYVKDHERAHWMSQYHDRVHYAGYGPIAEQVAAALDSPRVALVSAVGTGASSGSLTSTLEKLGVQTDLIGVQPFGSASFGSHHIEDPRFLISGTGSGIYFDNIDYSLFRAIHWINFDYARSGSIELMRRHGVFAGLSSGAAYLVAQWVLDYWRQDIDHPVVFVAPDTGHRYVEDVFASSDPVVERDPSHPLPIARQSELGLPWCWTDWAENAGDFSTPERIL
ncbi:pyridoxal-phosphate dependent enzyme [Streptomyces sp. 150FB]|uniref:pyridoxal-phosphate dependent enzyme n=1 Tax=Streptomyces sp. 150FB TaxID=1576605 RepID=UPI00099B59CA|nr:pyridoxal-phosphate dependent enzyme [Streptomyces sp. 150FB]